MLLPWVQLGSHESCIRGKCNKMRNPSIDRKKLTGIFAVQFITTTLANAAQQISEVSGVKSTRYLGDIPFLFCLKNGSRSVQFIEEGRGIFDSYSRINF